MLAANAMIIADVAHAFGHRTRVVVDTPEPPQDRLGGGYIGHQDWAKVGSLYVIIAKRGKRVVLIFGNPNSHRVNWKGDVFLTNTTGTESISRVGFGPGSRTMARQVFRVHLNPGQTVEVPFRGVTIDDTDEVPRGLVAHVGRKIVTLLAEVQE